ncbi:ResB protein required for cytochrome c biosynthesis-like protein [Clostridium aceticum]|uniref:ResB protein required for cytochrome c biosynthesis-like protein n=1 Tax=Clostridium aceticum TaxID=84022 RepID=A0A0D8I9S0_9CLOT|nr:cytochrome c biogenesis protein ResB [Clostridium aceticum]AKL95647.1 ResB protein required for cytochrome c biosynthesis-like protein [Clostridium aceticum]KJF26787.1 hypothetical protein TZ02_11265 [Clostridium aceticum]
MKREKKARGTIDLLRSMKFGLVLLGILGVFSVLGSLVPQGRDVGFYEHNYSQTIAKGILMFKIDDLYHSPYFIILFGALCLNLLLCSVSRFSSIIQKAKAIPNPKTMDRIASNEIQNEIDEKKIFKEIFKSYGFSRFKPVKKDNNKTIYYSKKSQIGHLGSWFIHLGVLLTIVFYAYGQFTYFTSYVYGVPGETKAVQGTNYYVAIHDFNIDYREDGSVRQYISHVDLKNPEGNPLKSSDIYVNRPMRHDGYAFYQSATGWATNIKIYREDELIKEDVLYETTGIADEGGMLAIEFRKFYPDFRSTENGILSVSNQPNNPKVLYSLFFMGQRVAMNVAAIGEPIHWQDVTFVFEEPQMYTYLQVNRMKGKIGAAIGSLLIMLGLILCFYRKPKELIVIQGEKELQIFGKNISV